MKIEQRTVGDVMVLAIDGDITLNETGATEIVDRVRSEIHEGQDRFVLDLGRVRQVDSAGLGELVYACSAVRHRGGSVKLLNVSKRLNHLLVLTRLAAVFDCFDHESDALASFNYHAVG